MSPGKNVWLLLERDVHRPSHYSLALIAEGKRLSEQLGGSLNALCVGMRIADFSEIAGSRGVDLLYSFPGDRRLGSDRLAASIVDLISQHEPHLLLSVASSFGSDVMPRIAARLGVPLITNCLDITVADRLEFSKAVQAGKLHATIRSPAGGLQMATLSPEALPTPPGPTYSRIADVIELAAPAVGSAEGLRIRGLFRANPKTVDIREAEFVVAIGNGVGTAEGRSAVSDLADMIGAAMGGSRPAVDAGVVPYERQIGQTGKKVCPRLIILCGISGSEYFMQGIEPGAVKIAINPDRKAPVFAVVDLGIVADASELIPKFIAFIRAGAGLSERPHAGAR